jgi:hypothetical protein
MANIYVRGSYEAKLWILDYYHPRTLPPVVGNIYDLYIYKKILKTCSDDDIYELQKNTKKDGFHRGIILTLSNMRVKLRDQETAKYFETQRLAEPNPLVEKIQQKEFDAEMIEARLEADARMEDYRKRNSYYNGGSIHNIPNSIIFEQKTVSNGKYKDRVEWKIYDKIYNCWCGVIKAPFVADLQIRHAELVDTERAVKTYCETMYQKSTKAEGDAMIKMMQAKRQQAEFQQQAKQEADKQVKEIKKILGMDGKNDLDSPDIF